jgi:hypothetical protein
MINTDYCQLPLAAEIFKCSVDDLLRLGATGQLSIYFFTAGLQLISEKYDDDEIVERYIIDFFEPLKLSRPSIELLEAGNRDALVGLDFDSNTTHKVKHFVPTIKKNHYDFAEMFADPVAWNNKTETDYHDVKISDVKLIVKHSELMCLLGSSCESKIKVELSEKEFKPWLHAEPEDPIPEQLWYVLARYFARKLVIDDSTLLTKRDLLANKVAHSLSNAGIMKRGGKKPLNPTSILKAFSNVTLG